MRKIQSLSSSSSCPVLWNCTYLIFFALFFKSVNSTLGNERVNTNTQIQGGIPATKNEFPFLVSLHYKSNSIDHTCCGSIIAKKFILTAAHCAYQQSASNFVAVMGTTILSKCSARRSILSSDRTIISTSDCVVAKIKKFHLHPNYQDSSLKNDIAIFELYDEISYSSTIFPVSLAATLPSYDSIQTVAGWGITSSTSNQASDHLMKTSVPYVEDKYCQNLGLDMRSSDGKLCAGAGDGKDACVGDSGSALFHSVNENVFVEIGIVSYGPTECGTEAAIKNRGVYTSVPFHKEWISAISNVSVGTINYGNVVDSGSARQPKFTFDLSSSASGSALSIFTVCICVLWW